MPRVNIYIRNADWERWRTIKDKPDFIHKALQKLNINYLNDHPEFRGDPPYEPRSPVSPKTSQSKKIKDSGF